MVNKHNGVAERAWSFLRVALIRTIKNGVFKRRVKFLKGIGHYVKAPRNDEISYYKERQLSFDETPIFHVKMHRSAVGSSMRFLLPCISVEEVDFDCDFGIDDDCGEDYGHEYDGGRKVDSTVLSDQLAEAAAAEKEQREEKGCEEGIDSKAEKFIDQFYEQMKLQRQISYLEYTEMLNRGAS
ncbi:CTP synthase family protein isoform 1 [Hibiscus syriacus]|uniref:CTP synthase family protein isoform 1 n=2 Tax=Hibiscus syriacus TaxID=106335 RepID=A0A6A2Z032_HIBSY|nr:CTP synthase family protein isoform 1 [Hibiscus syriacus]